MHKHTHIHIHDTPSHPVGNELKEAAGPADAGLYSSG